MSFVMLHSTFPESTRTSPGQAIWHSHFDILPKSDKILPKKRRFMQFTCMVIALPLHDSCFLLCQTSKWTFFYQVLPLPPLALLSVLAWSFYFNMVTWRIPCNLLGHTVTRTQWIYVTQLCLLLTQQLEKVFPSCAIVAVASPIMQLSARLVSSVAIAILHSLKVTALLKGTRTPIKSL